MGPADTTLRTRRVRVLTLASYIHYIDTPCLPVGSAIVWPIGFCAF